MPSFTADFYWRRYLSLTLLLDLDDTLLVNNMDTFVPAYLGAFSRHVANFVDPQKFVDALLGGTRQMTRNRRPDCTLQDVFEEFFFSMLQVDAGQFRQIADSFYADVFPGLRKLTHPNPGAIELVERALGRGYRLAIATNPLFPLTAIQQRLEWAGLAVEKYPFELVPSYATFHFAKPDPAYFAELLGKLGWPEGPILVVGDDLEMDIAAARQLGLPAFWLERDGVAPRGKNSLPSQSGGLGDILPWLDQLSLENLRPDYNMPAAMLDTLRATPAVLHVLCRDLSAEAWVRQPQPGEWSLTEILCHLRDVDQEVNLPRLQKVLAETNPFIPGRDTDPWAEQREYIRQDGVQALIQFTAVRIKMLALLQTLSLPDWQRPARHAILGPTLLIELVGIIAEHDRLHLRQTKKTL
jgi:FMN phosphatase YigB (HAD superfamily)